LDIEARELIRRRINEKFEMNEMNYLERKSFYLNSLDIAEAQAVFTRWYYSGNLYNHDKEPKNNRTGKFIEQLRNFIILCLELLENGHIKYQIS